MYSSKSLCIPTIFLQFAGLTQNAAVEQRPLRVVPNISQLRENTGNGHAELSPKIAGRRFSITLDIVINISVRYKPFLYILRISLIPTQTLESVVRKILRKKKFSSLALKKCVELGFEL